MPRPAIPFVQRDFSAGQVTENAARSDDVKLVRKGLKEALNCRLLNPRGFAPRFGRDTIYTDEGRTETVRFGVGMEYRITFGNGTVKLRDAATGDVVFDASGYPWTLTTLADIVWTNLEREIIVCFPDSAPYVINLRAAVETVYSYGAGSVIGNMTFNGGLAAAFDGNGNKAFSACASIGAVGGTYYAGKTFSTPRRVGKVIVRGANDTGYDSLNFGSSSITLTLRGKNGAAPASASDGTSLGTSAFSDNNTANEKTITSSDTATEFDHLWVQIDSVGVGGAFSDIRFFTPSGAEAWASAAFSFATNAISAKRQPYYKFAQAAVTMTPSALTGSITVTFSAPVLTSSHVGVSFRYGGRELLCTAYTSPTQGTFTVIEDLPPTHNVTVGSTLGFRIGDVAIGASSDCQALILDITSSTVMKCIYLKRFAGFISSEKVATETAVTTFSSTASTTAAASPIWDEAAMSNVRGWPRSVSQDRNRIIFCDLPLIGSAVAWSAIGLYNDFLPGALPTEAIFEYAPNNVAVKHVIGGPDEIVLTDKGIFYVPISTSTPLAPGSVEFKKIGSLAAGSVAPVEMDQGVVFGGSGGNSIIAVLPTGQQTAPWELRDVSRYHAGVISDLKALAVQSGGEDSAEQVLWALNGDGTAVSGRLDPENQWIGFLPVESDGLLKWISTFGSEVLMNVAYDLGASDQWVVERVNESRYIDGCVDLNDPGALLAGGVGDGPLWMYAGLTVDLMLGRRYLGTRAVDNDGELVELPQDDFSADGIVAGFAFTARAKQFLPNIDEGEARGQRLTRRKIRSAMITVRNATEFDFMQRTFAGFKASDAGEGDPPLWDSSFKARSRGRSYDPETVFEKATPGPCEVLELSGEVTV